MQSPPFSCSATLGRSPPPSPAPKIAAPPVARLASLTTLFPTEKPADPAPLSVPLLWARIQEINSKALSWIQRFEKNLDDTTFLNDWPVPYIKLLLVGFLHAGTEDVYCGRDNWLFFRSDIDYLTGKGFLDPKVLAMRSRSGKQFEDPPQPDPIKAILEFRTQLAARGVELIVAPAPPKTVICPDKFSQRFPGPDAALQNPSFQEFKQRLQKEGVKVFDPAESLTQASRSAKAPFYLKTDTHWNPAGAELVAKSLAEYVQQSGVTLSEKTAVYKREKKEVANTGDLAAMLRLPKASKRYPTETVTISRVTTPDGQPWRADPNAEILFLGDSFANIFSLAGMGWGDSAGLVEQFSCDMGRPVDRILINDNGSYSTRRLLSRDIAKGADRLAGKKLVIYEFAARELVKGDWKTGFSFAPPAVAPAVASTVAPVPTANKTPPTATPQTIRITGTIREITQAPKPGTVPYKDCVVAFHLTDLTIEKGSLADKEIVVFAWGLRDNKSVGAADYRTGQKVTLDLVPWEKAQDTYGGFNRVELDSDDLLLLPVFWAENLNFGRLQNTVAF